MSEWKQPWRPRRGRRGRLLHPSTSSWPFLKTSRHFLGNPISNENKNEVRSLFKVVSRSADLWYPEERRPEEVVPPPPLSSIFLSSELFSEFLPGKFNGCGIWTGKKRLWKFQRKWGFVPHEGSTSVCVLLAGGRERETEGVKDRGRASERFSNEQHRPLGEANPRQTGHDHLTPHLHDHA